ncbi:tRNA 2-selenouridine synthase [Saccharicrinis carchari]|uniref:tRNA 2-selenouridine synthase n=1 Tax=Saccharicrinis carchari TaxID=1168039 RepID=A0A521D451_SACCC|nr:tRNA 2-selenouridine(34) synthase MnmH [Saccharicrinis carchari]SMO66422.1 tRNA 2-selenouridine synthase [Saccharicrinis carchari]
MMDLSIETYYNKHSGVPIIDVRSPGEYNKGHIPGAVNIPLFSNEERADVGTVYKQKGQEKAIELGYTYVKPKLQWFLDKSLRYAPSKKVVVYCWRGGMRSHAFAEHLENNGFIDVKVIHKGYKAYRNFVLAAFTWKVDLKVIGGYTGSGKTHILHNLKELGCQIIDLECLACHKGSAFGSIGEKLQPTVEQFENNLFDQWRKFDFTKPVYIEDESHSIGAVKVPISLYNTIRTSMVYFLDVPKQIRAHALVKDYAAIDDEQLKTGIRKITKRLGGVTTNEAIEALNSKDYYKVAMLALNYYDKAYMRGVSNRQSDKIIYIELHDTDWRNNALFIKNEIESTVSY